MKHKNKIYYNEAVINNLRLRLESANAEGKPVYFDFKMDGMLLIPFTNQFEKFDSFNNFLHDDTEVIEFTIYSENPEDRKGTPYQFIMNDESETKGKQKSDLEQTIESRLAKIQMENKIISLEKELFEKNRQIVEQDEWIFELSQKIEELKANPNHFGKFDLSALASSALEGFVKRNPDILNSLPMNGILNGFAGKQNPALTKEREVQIEVKPIEEATAKSNILNEEEAEVQQFYINLGKELEEHLGQEELDLFISIAGALCKSPEKVKTVAELLDIQNPT